MPYIGGFGTEILILASITFPAGFFVTQGADDADYIDLPIVPIADSSMGVNGDHLVWSSANPLKPTLNVVPNSNNDKNLLILLNANRPALGKIPVIDVITWVISYPDGSKVTLKDGAIISGMPLNSIAQSGKFKTKPYAFSFGDIQYS